MTLRDYSEYTKLKDQVLQNIGASERYSQLLSTLKELFRDDINSPRRYEQITTMRQLLRVLEVRDVLSVNKVAPLKEIARRLPNSHELLHRINEYEANHVPIQFVNYYASEKTQSIRDPEPPAESTFIHSNPNTGMSVRKKQIITDTVIEDIGTNWRDLARGLDIKEKDIDDLNDKHKELSKKAKLIMEMYSKKVYDDDNWFFDLCDALETCNRREIVRKLKKIAVTKI